MTLNLVATAQTVNLSSGTSLVIDKPTGTVDGHLMVAVMGAKGGGATWTGATGWTEIFDEGNAPRLRIAYKVASSEGANYTFTLSAAGDTAGIIMTFSGATYAAVGSSVETSGTDNVVVPSVTTTSGTSLLVSALMTALGSTGFTTAVDMTKTAENTSSVVWTIYTQSVGAGATGTRTFSNTQASEKTGINFALTLDLTNNSVKPLFFGSPF